MKFLAKMFSTGISEGIKTVTSGVGSLAKDLRTAITGVDPAKAQELELLVQRAENLANAGQIEINKIEAGHKSLFVAGWRPYIGWVLGTSLALFYVPQFAMAAIIWVKLSWQANELVPYPIQDIAGLRELILAMLGLAGMRTFEKFRKVEGNR